MPNVGIRADSHFSRWTKQQVIDKNTARVRWKSDENPEKERIKAYTGSSRVTTVWSVGLANSRKKYFHSDSTSKDILAYLIEIKLAGENVDWTTLSRVNYSRLPVGLCTQRLLNSSSDGVKRHVS